MALSLTVASSVYRNLSHPARAAALAREACDIYRDMNDLYGLQRSQTRLVYAELEQGHFSECRTVIGEYIHIGQQLGLAEVRTNAIAFRLLGRVAFGEGNLDEATHHLKACTERWMRQGNTRDSTLSLAILTAVIAHRGDALLAAKLGSAIQAQFDLRQFWQTFAIFGSYVREGLALAQQALGEAEFAAAQEEGRFWSLPQAGDAVKNWASDSGLKEVEAVPCVRVMASYSRFCWFIKLPCGKGQALVATPASNTQKKKCAGNSPSALDR